LADGSAIVTFADGAYQNGITTNQDIFSVGQWTHLVVVQDSDTTVDIYANGEFVEKITNQRCMVEASSKNMQIGAREGTRNFNGLIDDVMIYNYALDANEAEAIFDSQKPFSAKTYYVSNSMGDDSWEGNSTHPWQTLSKVNTETFNPGDSILFKRGDIWRETLLPNGSGNSTDPITFGAYDTGNNPKITGANVYSGFTFNNGLYDKPTPPIARVLNNNVLLKSGNYPALQPGEWNWTSSTLYLYDNPAGNLIEGSVRDGGITISSSRGCDYLNFEDLTIEMAYWTNFRASNDNECNNVIIKNSTLRYSRQTNILGYGDNWQILNNTIIGGFSGTDQTANGIFMIDGSNTLIKGNNVSWCNDIGINIQTNNVEITSGEISHNIVSYIGQDDSTRNDRQCIMWVKDGGSPADISNILVHNNLVYSCGGAGIYPWRAISSRIYNNIVYDCGKLKNADLGNTESGIEGGDGVTDTQIYNNTVYDSYNGMRAWRWHSDSSGEMKNNIISNSAIYGIYIDDAHEYIHTFETDYNFIYDSGVAHFEGNVVQGANTIIDEIALQGYIPAPPQL